MSVYDEYKDSGTWASYIPSEWPIVKIKRLATPYGGRAIEGDGSIGTIDVYGSGGPFKKTESLMFSGEAVLFGRKGTLGKPIYVNNDFWAVDTIYYSVVNPNTAITKYLYYVLTVFDWDPYITHTAIPSIVASDAFNGYCPMPLLGVQTAIAAFLDNKVSRIDDLISEARASIEEYKQLKASTIYEAVTKGLDPNVEMKDSGVEWIGEIPAAWECKKIKRLFTITKRIAGEEGHTVLSITQQGVKPKNMSAQGQFAMDYSKYQFVHIGDFAMNHMDLLTGWVDVSKHEGVTSPDYRVFVMNNPSNYRDYFMHVFQTCYRFKIFYGLGQGVAGFGRWRLPADMFLNFEVPLPPPDEQERIASYLNSLIVRIDSLVSEKESLIADLEAYKKSLIYEVVTGKRKVV